MRDLDSLRCPLCDQIALHFYSLEDNIFTPSNVLSSLALGPDGSVRCQDCRKVLPPIDSTGHYVEPGATVEAPANWLCSCNIWKEGEFVEKQRDCPARLS